MFEFDYSHIIIGILAVALIISTIIIPAKRRQSSKDKTIDDMTTHQLNMGYDLNVKATIVPKHIAVIMDGNRRYGRNTHRDPMKGHWYEIISLIIIEILE
jgi:hypothetical protein